LFSEWLTSSLERLNVSKRFENEMQDTSTPTATSKSETNTPSSLPEPKPPVSAYNWFLKHKRLELSNDNDISSPDYMKKIAQMWKNLDPSQQQVGTLF
jgi:hypothetical protein